MKRKAFNSYRTKELTLPMGRPNGCFENATRAVLKYPTRLNYVEGFVICLDAPLEPIHHAWVQDRLTGERCEVTPLEGEHEYIGKEFTLDEMHDCDGLPVESPDAWTPQLRMAEQLELLTGAGYDVELVVEDDNHRQTTANLILVDMNATIAQTDVHYEWRIKESAAMKAGA